MGAIGSTALMKFFIKTFYKFSFQIDYNIISNRIKSTLYILGFKLFNDSFIFYFNLIINFNLISILIIFFRNF